MNEYTTTATGTFGGIASYLGMYRARRLASLTTTVGAVVILFSRVRLGDLHVAPVRRGSRDCRA